MSGATPQVVAETVAEAVAEARAEGVEAGAAAVEASVEAVAEAAAERVAHAEAAAQAVADAAMATELGRRIAALEERTGGENAWHGILERQAAALEQLVNLQAQQASLLAMLVEQTEPAPPPNSTPEPSNPAEPQPNPSDEAPAGPARTAARRLRTLI